MISEDVLRGLLGSTLSATDLALSGAVKYVGKVRDNYTVGDVRYLVATDRISAFDQVLGTIPLKGQVLNAMAAHWFRETAAIAPNHLLGVPDANVTLAVACEPLPVEMVMRGYLTGVTSTSVWTAYSRGAREFCGHRLPEGLQKNWPLPLPILTPSSKAAAGAHDVSMSRAEILALGVVRAADFDEAAAYAVELFRYGQLRAAQRGLILVDTKYEFGRALAGPFAGRIVLIDEIHTPDSSRYWHADDYVERLCEGEEPRSLDKEYVRRWLSGFGYSGDGPPPLLPDDVRVEAARRYIAAYELVTGRVFAPDCAEPGARMARNLGLPK